MSTSISNPKMLHRKRMAEVSKSAAGLKTFFSEKAAENWKTGMRGEYSGKLKSMTSGKVIKTIMGMSVKDLHAEGNEKARAARYLITFGRIYHDPA